jgi:hypothetical protein
VRKIIFLKLTFLLFALCAGEMTELRNNPGQNLPPNMPPTMPPAMAN